MYIAYIIDNIRLGGEGRGVCGGFAYLAVFYGSGGIKFTAGGATPELLNDWYAKVDLVPYNFLKKNFTKNHLAAPLPVLFFSKGTGVGGATGKK